MGDPDDLWLVDSGYQDPLDPYDREVARAEQRLEQLEAAGCSRSDLQRRRRAPRRANLGCPPWWRRPDPNGWEMR